MEIKDLLHEDSIILGAHNRNKQEAINKLIDKHYKCGHIKDKETFKNAIMEREKLSSTGVGNMIAIPHAQDDSVLYPSLVAMVDREGVDFDSLDQQPAKIFFMIAVPKDGGSEHLEILAQLCQILMDEKVVSALLKAISPKQFIKILTGEMKIEVEETIKKQIDIVAVTACPTGIAHTYMAAKSLEDTAKSMGIHIKVETNGASGIKNKLTKEDIQEAKGVIVAADKKVDIDRFNGKHLIQVPVAKGIHNAKELIEQALLIPQDIKDESTTEEYIHITTLDESQNENKIKTVFWSVYKHLMNGISNIIPLLMVYGIILSFLKIVEFDSLMSTLYNDTSQGAEFLYIIASVANLTLMLIIPVLCAFIAESISDRPGFFVGLVAGTTLLFNSFSSHSIIYAILIGYVAGYLVFFLNKIFSYLPELIHSIIPNLLIPVCGTIISVFLASHFIMSEQILGAQQYSQFIANAILPNYVLIIIGFVLGAMMSIDMGGPVNKIAYTIAIIGIFFERYDVMTAVMVAGMIPPIIIGLSMLLSPNSFTEEERKDKWRCIIKGLCFVSEEAIPYMTKNKKAIHLPCIITSGIAGALSLYYGCSQMFPHGGIFTLPLIMEPQYFLIALVASSLIGMSLILILKKNEKD